MMILLFALLIFCFWFPQVSATPTWTKSPAKSSKPQTRIFKASGTWWCCRSTMWTHPSLRSNRSEGTAGRLVSPWFTKRDFSNDHSFLETRPRQSRPASAQHRPEYEADEATVQGTSVVVQQRLGGRRRGEEGGRRKAGSRTQAVDGAQAQAKAGQRTAERRDFRAREQQQLGRGQQRCRDELISSARLVEPHTFWTVRLRRRK